MHERASMLHHTRTYIACLLKICDLLKCYSAPLDGLNLLTPALTKYSSTSVIKHSEEPSFPPKVVLSGLKHTLLCFKAFI